MVHRNKLEREGRREGRDRGKEGERKGGDDGKEKMNRKRKWKRGRNYTRKEE